MIMSHILEIVYKLARDNELFKKIDKSRLMESLSILVEKAPEKLIFTTDDELTQRIETVMMIEATAGMLKELTPEEMNVFEEAVKRREFFR